MVAYITMYCDILLYYSSYLVLLRIKPLFHYNPHAPTLVCVSFFLYAQIESLTVSNNVGAILVHFYHSTA